MAYGLMVGSPRGLVDIFLRAAGILSPDHNLHDHRFTFHANEVLYLTRTI